MLVTTNSLVLCCRLITLTLPVSNLAYVSKLVETAFAKQLQHYLFTNNLFPASQSAYLSNHSTETALLRVTNDILLNMNNQRVTLLLLLDLSIAFNTVDYDTLLHRLQFSFGFHGKDLSWYSLTSSAWNVTCLSVPV